MRLTRAEYTRRYYLKHKAEVLKRNRVWLDSHKEEMLHYWRVRKLGITFSFEEAQRLRFKQGNQCAICQQPETAKGRTLSLDHDHRTNKVRGFLCTNCNNGLGRFNDNIDRLKAAIQYLQA